MNDISSDFIELAKRHNKRFGTSYPTTVKDIELFFYGPGREKSVSTILIMQVMEQMKVRLMTEGGVGAIKNNDLAFFKFLTGVIVLGVTIASIVRATK